MRITPLFYSCFFFAVFFITLKMLMALYCFPEKMMWTISIFNLLIFMKWNNTKIMKKS